MRGFMSNTDKLTKQEPNFYTILGLSSSHLRNGTAIGNDALRAAYRRTLLLHHPDKSSTRSSDETLQGHTGLAEHFTVDQIVQAYETLSNATSRASYDEELRRSLKDTAVTRQVNAKRAASSISETFDLEELDYAKDRQLWLRSCRCGDSYQVTESQLENAAADGEIIVGCRGCSLHIRVVFQVVD